MIKGRKRWLIRGLAVVLIITMVVGYWASALITIQIASDEANAAMRYLAENTEYVQETKAKRTWSLIRSLKSPDEPGDYYLQASIKIGQGKYDEALVYIDKYLEYWTAERDSDMHGDLLIKKGCLQTLTDDYEGASVTLNKALKYKPDSSDIYLVLAQICYAENDLQGLSDVLQKYLEIEEDDNDMRTTYVQTLLALNDFDEAFEQSKILADSNVDISGKNEAYHAMAIISIERQEFDEAVTYLEKLSEYEDAYEDYHYDLGVCYMANLEFDKAIDEFNSSIEKEFNIQSCYYSRGVCSLAKEKPDAKQAYDDLKKAVDYQGEDRDEETVQLAQDIIEAAFVAQ